MKFCVWEINTPDQSVIIEAGSPQAAVQKLLHISKSGRGIVKEDEYGIVTQNGWTYKAKVVPTLKEMHEAGMADDSCTAIRE